MEVVLLAEQHNVGAVGAADEADSRRALLRRGFVLEYLTLSWNVAGVVILALTAIAARSVALAGFGLDSLIEIGASVVVVWELSGTGQARQRRDLALIGVAFGLLAWFTWPCSPPGSWRPVSGPGTV